MKSLCTSLFYTFLVSSFTVLLILSCDITDPVKDLKIIFNQKPIETVISGTVINAATGQPVTNTPVELVIEGNNKNDIVDLTSNPKTNFTINNGFISFALIESVTPSETSPAKIVVIASAEGYLPTSMPVIINSTGSTIFQLILLELTNLPEGVEKAETYGEVDNNGALMLEPLELTATTSMNGTYGSMFIPVGTKLKDASGNPLRGNITAEVIYFTNESEEALACFPGGFSVTINDKGNREDAVFISGGFGVFEITDAAGRNAVNIENPSGSKRVAQSNMQEDDSSKITLQISGQTINPETGSEIVQGDSIGVWTYIEETAEWNLDSWEEITGPDDNGNFSVSYSPEHLSPKNPDWRVSFCNFSRLIRLLGKPLGYPVTVKVFYRGRGFFWQRLITENSFRIPSGIRNLPVLIFVYNYDGTLAGDGVEVADLCTGGDIIIDLSITAPTTSRIIRGSGYCKCDSTIIIRPNGFPAWYKYTDWPQWYSGGLVENGEVTIEGLEIGQLYSFGTWYDGQWYEITARIENDFSVFVPELTSDNVIEVDVSGNVISYTLELSDNICEELCNN